MTVPVFVPDASILLKWVVRSADEEDQAPALALKTAWLDGRVDLIVPSLWVYEAGNVLGLKQQSVADVLLTALVELRLPEVAAASYHGEILGLMREYDVTFYDAAYHALAVVRRGRFLTADARYLRRASAAGQVQLLKTWTL